jgi:taurine dioxygenase
MTLTINLLSPSGAAEIIGLDCTRPLTPDLADEVRQVFLDHPVLLFRNQPLTAPQFAAFAEQFGQLESFGEPPPPPAPGEPIERPDTPSLPEQDAAPNLFVYYHPDDARVQFMTNEARRDMPLMGIQDNARTWHVDAQYRLKPNKMTFLSNVVCPSSGGDTEYGDMTLLYESLSDELRALLRGCVGIHQWSKSKNFMFSDLLDDTVRAKGDRIATAVASMRHPLVRRHPDTGRPSLFISPRFTIAIEGLDATASETLLRTLFQAIEDPRFTYRHRWREHDLIMWDNRRLVHRGHRYPRADVRHMNSITLHGERPVRW